MPRRESEGGGTTTTSLDATAAAGSGVAVMLLGSCREGAARIGNDKCALKFFTLDFSFVVKVACESMCGPMT
jgi:hypothetical protein